MRSIFGINTGDCGTYLYWIVSVRGGTFVQRLSLWFGKVHVQVSRLPRAVLIHFVMAAIVRNVIGVLVYLCCPQQVSQSNEYNTMRFIRVIINLYSIKNQKKKKTGDLLFVNVRFKRKNFHLKPLDVQKR